MSDTDKQVTDIVNQATDLFYEAAREFSKIQALAWAADQVLLDNDGTINTLELHSRVSYIIQVIAEQAEMAKGYYDVAASKIRSESIQSPE